MRTTKFNWTIKQFTNHLNKGTVSFDYPIQRAGGQWDLLQKSLLIHSIACEYPIPNLYSLVEKEMVGEGSKAKQMDVFYILDGKQRLTSIRDFLAGEYRLSEDTPTFKVEGNEYELAKFKFDELPEEVKDAILSRSLDVYKIEEALDSEIEDMFFRLNNGTSLSQQQKAKAKMGSESAKAMQRLARLPLMTENASFTPLQIKKADDEVAIVQAMMLLDDNYTVSRFGTKEVFDYSTSLREGKEEVFEKIEKAMEYLHNTIGSGVKEKKLLSKLHFPMVILASQLAMQAEIPESIFAEWLQSFKEQINSKENGEMLNGSINPDAWLYKLGCGAGATKAEKVSNRYVATKGSIDEFIQKVNKSDFRTVDVPKVDDEKAEAEAVVVEVVEETKTKSQKRKSKAEKEAEAKAKLEEQAKAQAEAEAQDEGQTEAQEGALEEGEAVQFTLLPEEDSKQPEASEENPEAKEAVVVSGNETK